MTQIIASAILALVGLSALYAAWSIYRTAYWVTALGGLFLAVLCAFGLISLAVAWGLVA